MAPSKVLLLLGLALAAVVLISSEAASARGLARPTRAGKHSLPRKTYNNHRNVTRH